ncbi:MAG: HAD family hydrolase [Candidatus Odinarchaeia archaeon]
MRIKGLIFDLDGTLIKTPGLPMFNKILIETLRGLGVKENTPNNMMELWKSGKNNKKILRNWGVSEPLTFWREFDKNDFKIREKLIKDKQITPYEDIKIIKELSERYTLGIVSNSSREVVDLEVDAFNLRRYFKSIISLGTIHQDLAKPEPHGLLWCVDKLGLRREECIYIGDLKTDFIAGKRAGITTYIVKREHNIDQLPATNIIYSLNEIKGIAETV